MSIERFISHVEINDETGCWLWTLCRYHDGYGKVKMNGKVYSAHRLAYELFVDDIPDGMYVCHKCDVPNCVNPTHLFIGTRSDNMRDMHSKNRQGKGYHVKKVNCNPQDVRELFDSGVPKKKIARIYHINPATVRSILRNQSPPPPPDAPDAANVPVSDAKEVTQ